MSVYSPSETQYQYQAIRHKKDKADQQRKDALRYGSQIAGNVWGAWSDQQAGDQSTMLGAQFNDQDMYQLNPKYQKSNFLQKMFTPASKRVSLTEEGKKAIGSGDFRDLRGGKAAQKQVASLRGSASEKILDEGKDVISERILGEGKDVLSKKGMEKSFEKGGSLQTDKGGQSLFGDTPKGGDLASIKEGAGKGPDFSSVGSKALDVVGQTLNVGGKVMKAGKLIKDFQGRGSTADKRKQAALMAAQTGLQFIPGWGQAASLGLGLASKFL